MLTVDPVCLWGQANLLSVLSDSLATSEAKKTSTMELGFGKVASLLSPLLLSQYVACTAGPLNRFLKMSPKLHEQRGTPQVGEVVLCLLKDWGKDIRPRQKGQGEPGRKPRWNPWGKPRRELTICFCGNEDDLSTGHLSLADQVDESAHLTSFTSWRLAMLLLS